MKYTYPACFYLEKDGGYTVTFPDFDNVATCGDDLTEAIYMAEDLLCVMILDYTSHKKKLREPSNIDDIIFDTEIEKIANKGFINYIMGDMDLFIKKNNKSVKKTLTIPFWLNELAEKDDINFSRTLQEALKEKLHVG